MYIAVHVATAEATRSKEQELRLSADGRTARLDDYLIVIAHAPDCKVPGACEPLFGVTKLNTQTAAPTQSSATGADATVRLSLPVPKSDGEGGLYDALVLRWLAPCSEHRTDGCRKEQGIFAHYEGSRTADLRSAIAKDRRV